MSTLVPPKTCLKCGHVRPSAITAAFDCPRCGAIYHKVEQALARGERVRRLRFPDQKASAATPSKPAPTEEMKRKPEQIKPAHSGFYTPNHVPIGARLLYALFAFIWICWAGIGVYFGHMYFLLSRGGPIHFSGLASLIFSAAVFVAASKCALTIIDHYDRRDNEAKYKKMHQRLFRIGIGLFVLSLALGLLQLYFPELFPEFEGLGAGEEVKGLVQPGPLWHLMRPLKEKLDSWFIYSLLCVPIGILVGRMIGIKDKNMASQHPEATLVLTVVFGSPLFVTATLGFGMYFFSGDLAAEYGNDFRELKKHAAWGLSTLLGFAATGLFLALGAIAVCMRRLGYWPPLSDKA